MTINLRNGLIALAVLSLVGLGCSAMMDGKPAAEQAIANFHSKLDQERYAEIYADLDPRFKEVTSEEEMTKILTAVHTKLGNVRSSTNSTWNASNYNLTSYINMVQNTDFDSGKAEEQFTFIYADKKVSLAGYHVNSMDLITK